MLLSNPLISIILPNYNGAKYLSNSIKSFLEQDYKHKELIIVDAKSSDESHKIISSFSKNENIHWINEIDRGISSAFNMGLKRAKGEIIGYLGSDDLLYKNIFNEIAYHANSIDFDAIYFDSYTYYVKEKKCFLRKCPNITFTKENLLKFGTIVGWQNIFFKRELYKEFEYDEENKYSMDYEFYLKIAHKNLFYFHLEYPGSINFFDNNISTDADGKQFKEACTVAEKYKDNYTGEVYFSSADSKKRNKIYDFFFK